MTFKNHINKLKKRFQDQLVSYINLEPMLQLKSSLVFIMQLPTCFIYMELLSGETLEKLTLYRYSLYKINLFVWLHRMIVFLNYLVP